MTGEPTSQIATSITGSPLTSPALIARNQPIEQPIPTIVVTNSTPLSISTINVSLANMSLGPPVVSPYVVTTTIRKKKDDTSKVNLL